MSTTTLTLYSGANWELLPEKLLVVENIENFLATKTSTQITNFQYLKNKLELSIKVDLSQNLSQPKDVSFKYVKVLDNDTSNIYYYFIKECEWTSASTIRLNMVMDVLNTFHENTHYFFKPNTRIIREHKDRFQVKNINIHIGYVLEGSLGTISPGDNVTLYGPHGQNVFSFYVSSVDTSNIEGVITNDISISEMEDSFNEAKAEGGTMFIMIDDDNFLETLSSSMSLSYTYDIFRNIDEIPENINPLLQCGNADGVIINNNKTLLDCDWYLLYKNQNDPDPSSFVNPVDCYLIPSKQINVDAGYIVGGRLIPSFLESGKYYYFAVTSGQVTLSNGVTLGYGVTGRQILVVTKGNEKINIIYFYVGTQYGDDEVVITSYDGLDYLTFNSVPVPYRIESSFLNTGSTDYYALQDNMPYSFTNSGTYSKLDTINLLDRTDAKNIKLIKLPYCPYDFNISGTTLQIASDTNWEYVSLPQVNMGNIYCLKLKNLSLPLHSSITLSIYSKNPIMNLKMNSFTPSINNLRRDISFESKLFHSEFYQGTYIYDSFAFKLQLEKCNVDAYISSRNLLMYFDVTRTINSKFLFTFATYYLRDAEQNYPKSLPIARNNEEVLYNVPYINYIRTGFNYDIKMKNINTASSWLNVGLGAVSMVTSLAMPSAPLKIAGVIGSLVSMATSVKGAIVSTIQGEENIKQKLLQAQNQTASVAGSDDVDLMSVYAQNRLKYLVYQPREVMKNMLFDLFFYAGYNSGRMGLPNHNTRVNFDYLECEASIQKTNALPQDCMNELINAFKSGVTYLHETSRSGADKWDFNQIYENWEKSLM